MSVKPTLLKKDFKAINKARNLHSLIWMSEEQQWMATSKRLDTKGSHFHGFHWIASEAIRIMEEQIRGFYKGMEKKAEWKVEK